MTKLLQPSFNGGELSPSLYARVDLARYGTSVKTAYNFIGRQYGGLVNRSGFQFCDEAKFFSAVRKSRVIPFEFNQETAYVVELGHFYARFYFDGALVEDAGTPVEVVTPWSEDEIFAVRFTQSADTVYLAHPDHPTQVLTRTSATAFSMSAMSTKNGPFRRINSDEAIVVAASAITGTVTVTASADIFTSDMVGSYFYLESKNLGKVKPWTLGERGITVGTLRRSDGKTYKAVSVPSGGGATWTETGSFRPIHENGRYWDGGGDVRTDGTNTWIVGIEWEYQDSSYGIVLITGFTSATQVTGTVTRQLPADVVGGVGAAANTWPLAGDGVTTQFAIAGATDPSNLFYTVTIDGVLVQSNPNYDGGGDIDTCVTIDSYMLDGRQAEQVVIGDVLELFDAKSNSIDFGEVSRADTALAECVSIITENGVTLECSTTAPIPTINGIVKASDLKSDTVLTRIGNLIEWSVIKSVTAIGERQVRHITVENACFWAGKEPGKFILHHNIKP